MWIKHFHLSEMFNSFISIKRNWREILLNYLSKFIIFILAIFIDTLQLTFHMLSGSLYFQQAQLPNRVLTHSVLNCDRKLPILSITKSKYQSTLRKEFLIRN